MSTKRRCARCKKAFWTSSYCSPCEVKIAKTNAQKRKQLKLFPKPKANKQQNRPADRRTEDESGVAPDGANLPPISLGSAASLLGGGDGMVGELGGFPTRDAIARAETALPHPHWHEDDTERSQCIDCNPIAEWPDHIDTTDESEWKP